MIEIVNERAAQLAGHLPRKRVCRAAIIVGEIHSTIDTSEESSGSVHVCGVR
jgi:hypothetical protein